MTRICSVYFPSPKPNGAGHDYHRLVCALTASAMKNDPESQLDIRVIRGTRKPGNTRHKQGMFDNTDKFHQWVRFVEEAEDGERLALIDCDMLLLRPLGDVWNDDFDLAYTIRPPGRKYKFNGGVVFVRVSESTRRFMRMWKSVNDRMMANHRFHQPWRSKYAGINQASFGYILENCVPDDVDIMALRCEEWNCEDTTWTRFNPAVTRLLHLKSALRKICLDQRVAPTAHLRSLKMIFRKYEALAKEMGITYHHGQNPTKNQEEQASPMARTT